MMIFVDFMTFLLYKLLSCEINILMPVVSGLK